MGGCGLLSDERTCAKKKCLPARSSRSGAAALKFTTVPASTASVGDDSDDLSTPLMTRLVEAAKGARMASIPLVWSRGSAAWTSPKPHLILLAIRAGVGGLFDVPGRGLQNRAVSLAEPHWSERSSQRRLPNPTLLSFNVSTATKSSLSKGNPSRTSQTNSLALRPSRRRMPKAHTAVSSNAASRRNTRPEDFCKYQLRSARSHCIHSRSPGDPIELLSDPAKAHFDPQR